MELRTLRFFLAVASEQNFTRAAAQLHTSQPNLSRQIKNLEQELGVQLFKRTNSAVELTANGYYLQTQARKMLQLAEQTIANIQQTEDINGHIQISAGESRSMMTVTKAIAHVTHAYPHISVAIISADAEEVFKNIRNGLSDFGIIMGIVNNPHYESIKLPEESRWGLFVPQDHYLANKTAIHVQDLKKIDLIKPLQKHYFEPIEAWLNGTSLDIHVVGEYNLINNAISMVRANVGVALGLDQIANLTNTGIRFIPLDPPLTSEMNVIWQKGAQLSPAARLLLNRIKELSN